MYGWTRNEYVFLFRVGINQQTIHSLLIQKTLLTGSSYDMIISYMICNMHSLSYIAFFFFKCSLLISGNSDILHQHHLCRHQQSKVHEPPSLVGEKLASNCPTSHLPETQIASKTSSASSAGCVTTRRKERVICHLLPLSFVISELPFGVCCSGDFFGG